MVEECDYVERNGEVVGGTCTGAYLQQVGILIGVEGYVEISSSVLFLKGENIVIAFDLVLIEFLVNAADARDRSVLVFEDEEVGFS